MQAHLGYPDQPLNEGAGEEECGFRTDHRIQLPSLPFSEY
jgi:hypothetical protein